MALGIVIGMLLGLGISLMVWSVASCFSSSFVAPEAPEALGIFNGSVVAAFVDGQRT